MANRLNPYLNFAGNTREAMEFYQSVLGGELTVSTFAEIGGAEAEAYADQIMHAQLVTPAGFTLMAADRPEFMGALTAGNNFHLSLSGDDGEALRGYWTGLAEGGTIDTALEKQVWGDEFGQLTDRFGMVWLVNIVAAG